MYDETNHTHEMASNWKLIALLVSFFLFVFILPLGVRDLIVPDETRYAEIPREMVASDDWVVPRLNGLRYFEKPILGYWVHAASLSLFGENNFAVRLPSAIAMGLSALLIGLLVGQAARKDVQDGGFSGILAALIFMSCFGVFGIGNTAVLDSLFSLFLTACITAFYFATEAPQGSFSEKGFLLLAGLCCGLAFLTKGFLALALPVLVITPYLVWQRRYKDLLRMSWLPILTAVLTVLPWGILIHLKEPDFWHHFFWNEHIRRFVDDKAQHKESLWFFFKTAPVMFLPWTFLAPAAIFAIKPKRFEHGKLNGLLRLCVCWLILPFLFFSVAKGKLLTYILPCFPPFAIIMAVGLNQLQKEETRKRLFQAGILSTAVFFSLLLIVFIYAQFHGLSGLTPYSRPWKAMMVVNGLFFFSLLSLWSFRIRNFRLKPILFGIAPFLLFFVLHFTIPDTVVEKKAPGTMLEQLRQNITNNTVVISDGDSVRAVCWYLERNDIYVLGRVGELGYGLRYKDAQDKLLNLETATDLINKNHGNAIIFARVRNAIRWRNQLPLPVEMEQNGPDGYVCWKY